MMDIADDEGEVSHVLESNNNTDAEPDNEKDSNNATKTMENHSASEHANDFMVKPAADPALLMNDQEEMEISFEAYKEEYAAVMNRSLKTTSLRRIKQSEDQIEHLQSQA